MMNHGVESVPLYWPFVQWIQSATVSSCRDNGYVIFCYVIAVSYSLRNNVASGVLFVWIWLDILMTSETNHGGSFVQYAFNFVRTYTRFVVLCWLAEFWSSDFFYLMLSQFASIRDINSARWRHKMETFSALLVICAGNSPVHSLTKTGDAELWSFLWSAPE